MVGKGKALLLSLLTIAFLAACGDKEKNASNEDLEGEAKIIELVAENKDEQESSSTVVEKASEDISLLSLETKDNDEQIAEEQINEDVT